MQVLHTIDSAGLYGAETVLLNLAAEQQKAGIAPLILSVGNKRVGEKAIEVEARNRGIPCIAFRMHDGPNFLGAWQIVKLAHRHRVDVIHSHNYKSNILLGLLPAFLRRLPLITTLHGWTAAISSARFSRIRLYCYMDQKVLKLLDAVVTVNPELQQSPAIRRLSTEKLHVIPNGIPIGRTATVDAHDTLAQSILALKAEKCLVLGAIGRLSHEKNFGALVQAIRQLADRRPEIRAIILGAGPEAAQITEQIRDAGLAGKVLLQGYIENAGRYLPLFDALVIPSLTEGLPMVLLEAMAAETPVIASAVGGIPSTLNGLGLLAEPGNTIALAEAIEQFAENRQLYKERAILGRSRVEDEYSARTMAARYQIVYQTVAKKT